MRHVLKMTSLLRRSFLLLGGTILVVGAAFATTLPVAAKDIVIGMLPKFTSDPYFVAVNKGAQEAAAELGVTVEFNGSVNPDVAAQADLIDRWVRRGVSAIAVSAADPDALVPSLRRAQSAGIKTMTWDADTRPEGRSVFLNQATFDGISQTLTDMMVRDAGSPDGDFLIVTATLTSPNQNVWIDGIKKYAARKYPTMKFAAILPGDNDIEKAKNVTLNYLQANPNTKGVLCVDSSATVGAVEAIKQLGLVGKVSVTGLGTPSLVRNYLKDGSLKEVALWNPIDIGYGAIYITKALLDGKLDPASGFVEAGRLGKLKFISKDTVLLGEPYIFTKDNVDKFDF